MKKFMLLIILTFLYCQYAKSQAIYPNTLTPLANQHQINDVWISFNLGQISSGSSRTNNHLVAHGFQQPYSENQVDPSLFKYEIGKISPQTVWQTLSIRFYLYSKTLGPKANLSITADKLPKGSLTFDPAIGYFTFTPATTDTSSFKVTFKATLNKQIDSQVVDFQVQPFLPLENTVFGVVNSQNFPDPTSKEYRVISDHPITSGTEYFNHEQRTTRSVEITGMEIVIEEGHQNSLYNFNDNKDIKEFKIYAERVVMKSYLKLPQTNVTIFARELIFENDAYINTTPERPLGPQTGTDIGIDGVKAGDITLHIKEFKSSPKVRFIQIGGDGQKGVTAKAGDAGDGGDLYSTLNVIEFSDRSGGLGGAFETAAHIPDKYKGGKGTFNKLGKEYSWLHPNYIRLVKKYTDDAFFLGFSQYAKERLSIYYNEIDNYISSNEFILLQDSQKLDLEQLQSEANKIISQIENNLDYFGNPPGWVPMLSFEVNAAAFQTEIDHALNILYLNYWITESSKNIQDKISALKASRSEKISQLEDDKISFEKYVLNIPKLEAEASNNSKDLDSLQNDLVELETELINRAKNSVEEKRRSNLWRDIVGTVGRIATLVPVPAVSAVGIGLTAISQFDTNDLSGSAKIAIQAGEDISNTLKKDSKASQNAAAWNKAYKEAFPLTDIKSFEDAGKKFKNLETLSKPFKETFGILKDITNKQQSITDNEVKAVLGQLRASEPRIAQITEKIEDLHKKQQNIIEELRSSDENIQRLGNEMSSGVLAIDLLNKDVSQGSQALDQRTLLYLDDLQQQALFRLKKYHYFMAKAYEYRTLQQYKGNLNLENLYKSIVEIAVTGSDHTLSPDQFDKIKSFYLAEIRKITSLIVNEYNSSATARSTSNFFNLTKEELKILNNGGTLQMNMVERGVFFEDREDIRINNLSIEYVNAKAIGGNTNSNPQIEIVLEYPHYSKLKKNGQIYFFNNYNIDAERSKGFIEWSAVYFMNSKRIENSRPSDDFDSLIKFLLQDLRDNSTIFSKPAAWADITIRKQDLQAGDAKLEIDSLTFKLDYDYMRKPASISNIEIIASEDWMAPYFTLDREDKNFRKDGRGHIFRSFNRTGQNLNITAPLQYGKWEFVNWTDRSGKPMQNAPASTTLSLPLNGDYVVKANYRLIEPIIELPDTIFVSNTTQDSFLEIKNIGNMPMEWVADNSSNWITFSQNNRGVDLPQSASIKVPIAFEVNTADKRIGYISVIAPDASDYRDTVYVVQGQNIVTTTGASRCGPGSVTLEAEGAVDGNYRWYTTQIGGTPITLATNSKFITPNLDITTTYYVSVVSGTVESQRTPITATIKPLPSMPSVNDLNYCQGTIANPLTATGENLKWYAVATGGTGSTIIPTPNTSMVGKTEFYVTQTINDCESERAKIIVTVTSQPIVALAPFTTNVCSTNTAFTLTGGQPAGGTYLGPGVSNNIFDAVVAGVGTHAITYSYTENGCTATTSQNINVTTCTGIVESKLASSLLLYPNPTSNKFQLKLPVPRKISLKLRLVDAKGQVLMEKHFDQITGEFNQVLDLDNKANGIYLLQLILDDGIIIRRVVKE
ncbi:Ig-like domain-containing protein [Rufibacter latericius]|nr:T9SS type A sorting domain-containing protein [Rufibacter latericius]